MKLKTPVVDAEMRFQQPDARTAGRLRRVEHELGRELELPAFEEIRLGEPLPRFFRFEGSGARLVTDNEFWIASHIETAALVLVGASRHAMHGASGANQAMSPSADPLGAIVDAAEEAPSVRHSGMEAKCSYAWQVILRHSDQHRITVPRIRGIAVTTACVAADRAQIRRAGVAGIERLVVGTPLFVEQI